MRTLTPFWTKNNLSLETPFSFWKEMDRIFDDLPTYRSSQASELEKEFSPALEIAETEKAYNVSFDLPGLKKEEIKIEMHENTLTVSGERKREQRFEDQQIQRMEKSYGFFKRSFTLPTNADADKVEAKYENGVLELSIPKTEIAPAKKIAIQ